MKSKDLLPLTSGRCHAELLGSQVWYEKHTTLEIIRCEKVSEGTSKIWLREHKWRGRDELNLLSMNTCMVKKWRKMI